MKKYFSLAAGLLVVPLALAGCSSGSSGGGSSDGTTIELWTAWTEGASTAVESEKQIQAFEDSTGYTVNQTNFTYDMLHDKLIASAAGGNLPDVVWGLPEYVGEFAKLGILADLSDAWDSWGDAGKVSDSVKGAMTVDGSVVGFPYETTVRAYLVHDDLMSQAGVSVPATWDDVLALGSRVQDAAESSAYGLTGTGVRAPQELLVYLAQEGLAIADPQDGGGYRNTWQDDAGSLARATEVFQFYKDLMASGAVNPNSATYGWEDTDENFATGLTASFVTGNWMAERESTNADTMADVSVHPVPYPTDGQPATYIEAKPMFVMATSDSLDASTQLAEAFASEDWQQAAFTDRSALSDVSTDSKWSKDFAALLDSGVTYPPVSMANITQNMIDSLAMVLQDDDDPQDAAAWLSDAINSSLQDSGDLAG